MISFFLPYLSYLKWGAIALLVAALSVQTLRVAWKNTDIANQKVTITKHLGKIAADNATITLYQQDQENTDKTIAGLRIQIKTNTAAFELWKKNNARITTVVDHFVSVPATPKIEKKEVLDEKSSINAVDTLNSILRGLLR